jgi:hypothetical protein
MGYFKTIGGVTTPFFQKKKPSYETTEEEHSKENPYWYKKDGVKITKHIYCKWQKKIPPDTPPTFNLQTNDPDACGLKAKRKKEREDNQKKPK